MSQFKGGFRALSRPTFNAAGFPAFQPLHRPMMPPSTLLAPVLLAALLVGPAPGEPIAFLPPKTHQDLLVLPHNCSQGEAEIQSEVANLQNLSTESPAQQNLELMDMTGSMVTPSEAATSEMPSKQRDQENFEASMFPDPESVQESENGEDDEDDEEDDSDEDDESEGESEGMLVAEAKSVKPSGAGPKGKGID